MKKYVVYLHKNRINGKCYVGITSIRPETRWVNGEGYKGCTAFYGAIQKYGWHNFSHEILYTDLDREAACELEKRLIVEFNSRVPNGYNLESGGIRDVEFSEETRKRISRANKGWHWDEEHLKLFREINLGAKNPMYGKKASAETRKKQSAAHTGQVNWWLHKKIGRYDTDGNLTATYPSLSAAANKMGVGITAISNCVNGRTKSSCGFYWKYIDNGK